MPYLPMAQDRIKGKRLEFLGKLGGIDIERLDFSFDVLFFIGEELVNFAITVDKRVALQKAQRLLNF